MSSFFFSNLYNPKHFPFFPETKNYRPVGDRLLLARVTLSSPSLDTHRRSASIMLSVHSFVVKFNTFVPLVASQVYGDVRTSCIPLVKACLIGKFLYFILCCEAMCWQLGFPAASEWTVNVIDGPESSSHGAVQVMPGFIWYL